MEEWQKLNFHTHPCLLPEQMARCCQETWPTTWCPTSAWWSTIWRSWSSESCRASSSHRPPARLCSTAKDAGMWTGAQTYRFSRGLLLFPLAASITFLFFYQKIQKKRQRQTPWRQRDGSCGQTLARNDNLTCTSVYRVSRGSTSLYQSCADEAERGPARDFKHVSRTNTRDCFWQTWWTL